VDGLLLLKKQAGQEADRGPEAHPSGGALRDRSV